MRTQLGELADAGGIQTGPFGSQLHAREYTDRGVPVVMPKDIGDNSISTESVARVPQHIAERLDKHRLRAGDIVYSRRGDVTKRAWVLPSQAGWICGTGCLRVRLNPSRASSRFISYALGSPEVRTWLTNHAVGATMPNLNTAILSAVPLHVPDLATQTAIADVLGALDDKIAANERVITGTWALAQALFDDAAARTPLGRVTYGDIARVTGGGTPRTDTPEFWNGAIRWATPTDVTALSAPFLFDTARRITEVGLDACASELYEEGSILMTSRATIGAFAVAAAPVAVNQGFIVARPFDPAARWWLLFEMRSRVLDYLAHANGATFLELSRGAFKRLPARWPSDKESLVNFHESVDPLLRLSAAKVKENARLVMTRDALLPNLMTNQFHIRPVK